MGLNGQVRPGGRGLAMERWTMEAPENKRKMIGQQVCSLEAEPEMDFGIPEVC